MPTYSYRCDGCGETFERVLSMTKNDQPEKEPCPNCGELKVKQFIGTIPDIGDPVYLGVRKLPADWRDFLKRLKKANPGSYVKDR